MGWSAGRRVRALCGPMAIGIVGAAVGPGLMDAGCVRRMLAPGGCRVPGSRRVAAIASTAVTGAKSSPQNFQVARYSFDPSVEVRQVELLVGSVQIVVRKSEAHHDAGDAQVFVEHADDRDAPA